MKRLLLFIFLFTIVNESIAQKPLNVSGRRVSRPVKWWVIKHLFIAHKAKCLTQIALEETRNVANSKVLDNDTRGGQLDAFRHSYWMALLAQEIKPWKVMRLGIAHEKGNFIDFKRGRAEEGILPDKMSSAMDLYNNQVGVNTGYMFNNVDMETLKLRIIELIKKGSMVVINKDASGNFFTCDDSLIDLKQYENTWDIPKCLVRSDIH